MLKRISGLLLILLTAQTSAYAPLAYAASDTVVITHIQAGVTGGATQEFIGLYNNGSFEVDITDWCLRNKNDADIACFSDGERKTQFILPPQSSALVASESFIVLQPLDVVASLEFAPLSSSSGSIVGSNDHISLVDTTNTVIDSHSWTVSSGSLIFQRQATTGPLMYMDTDVASDWVTKVREVPVDQVELREIAAPPEEPVIHPMVTELLPNAEGSDTGNEFIELYNSGDMPVDLTKYELWLGLEPKTPIKFPTGVVIEPGSYLAVTNAGISYSLVNTSGKVALKTIGGEEVSVTDVYNDPRDNYAWAFIEGTWQYTNQPTPGTINLLMLEAPKEEDPVGVAVLKPCAANQYRHPETRRCRLLKTAATSMRTPCKANQYRSPETNRCRNVATTKTPAPCKTGQERNPDTGRCRNIKQMTTADYSVLAAKTESQPNQWYIVGAIVALLGLLIAYGIWEWRTELKQLFQKALRFVQGQK